MPPSRLYGTSQDSLPASKTVERCSERTGCQICDAAGNWVNGKREGEGICQFADGRLFRGDWQEDSWLQSEAEPSLSKLAGAGLAQAVAGADASFSIIVSTFPISALSRRLSTDLISSGRLSLRRLTEAVY